MRGCLVHHIILISTAVSLPLLRGAAVGRAPTIFQNDWFCTIFSNFHFFRSLGKKFLMIQPGKLQPVFIWREKRVLLALLNNLTIPAPSSYPVFRTKWCKIS